VDDIHEQVEMIRVCIATWTKTRMWRMSALIHYLSPYEKCFRLFYDHIYFVVGFLGLATVYVMV